MRSLANSYARKMLDQEDGVTEIHKSIDSLEKLVSTLKEVAKSEPQEESDKVNHVRVVLRQAQAVDHQIERVIKVVKKGVS